jgi:hypothetical protein
MDQVRVKGMVDAGADTGMVGVGVELAMTTNWLN